MITMVKAIPKFVMRENKERILNNEPPQISPIFKDYDIVAALSITSPLDYSIFTEETDRVMVVHFDDVTPSGAYKFGGLAGDQFITTKQAQRILGYIESLHSMPEKVYLVVNCAAGVCRSGAVARFVYEMCQLDGELFDLHNHHIQPNVWVYDKLYEALILKEQGE